MMLKRIFMGLLFAVVLAAGWRVMGPAGGLSAWLQPRSTAPAKPIEFDNGSVRALQQAASDAVTAAVAKPQPRVPGRMRKCKKGDSVVYTDAACPTGSREMAVSGGTVTVVDGPKPPPGEAQGEPQGPHRPNVRDLLGPDRGQSLADKQMERAMSR